MQRLEARRQVGPAMTAFAGISLVCAVLSAMGASLLWRAWRTAGWPER